MDNEKRETQLIFMSAVNVMITGVLAGEKADLDDVIDWLGQIKQDYIEYMGKFNKETEKL